MKYVWASRTDTGQVRDHNEDTVFPVGDGVATDGIIETRTQGLNSTIEDYADQRVALNERLASLETRLLRQFNALDSLLGQLNSTSSFLTQQLNNLPGFTTPDSNR